MAKTYYKYKDRGQQVDYAEISSNFSQGIMDTVTGIKKEADEFSDEVKDAQKEVKKDVEERFKEKRKAAGKSVTGEGDYKIELGEYDVPMGGERDANTVFVGLSTTASDRALEFKREYDSQKISANEYLQKKNALDRTFRVMKESAVAMNKLAEETATGLKDGTTDPTQQLAFQELMSYNFTDPRVKIEIGDDGAGYMYRVDDKGKELPRTRKTINEYRNMAIQRYDSYDFDGNATEIVTKLGKTLETLGRRGMTTEELLKREPIMTSVSGGTLTPMDVIDDYANGLEDDDLASILMSQLGSDYSPTFNPEVSVTEDASGNFTDDQSKILFVKRDLASGINKKTAQLTDEQRERAREFVKTDILSQFNVNPAATTSGKAPSSAQIQAGNARDKAVVSINTLADWYGAKTPEDRRTAAAGLGASLGTNFISLVPSPDGKTATLTSIQEVSGKDVQVDTDISMEGVSFDQFIKSFGKALTGQDLSQYYSDFVASGRTVNLAPIDPNTDYSVGAYKKTFKQPPKDLSQELADVGTWRTNVVKTIDDIDVGTSTMGFGGQTDEGVNESFEGAISDNLFAAGISDYDVSRTDNNIKIKVDGLGEISVAVGRKDSDKAKVKKILSDVYTRVSKGEMIDGSGIPDDPIPDDPNSDPADPAGGDGDLTPPSQT